MNSTVKDRSLRPLTSLTVEELVGNLSRSSPDQESDYYRELFRRFEPLLRRAWLRVGFGEDYADYAQQVFIKVFQEIRKLENPKAFPGYFRAIALSTAIDRARRHRYDPDSLETHLDHLVSRFDEEILATVFVHSYLEHLPEREREVISLEFLEGVSLGQIAARLGQAPGSVRATKSRALKRLRKLIAKEGKVLEKEPRR